MTNAPFILAEAGDPIAIIDGAFSGRLDLLNHPSNLVGQLEQMHPLWGGSLLVIGLLSLLNGYRWHKGVITTLAALVGVAGGMWIGRETGNSQLISAVSLATLFAVLALPGLRFAAAFFGGVTGAFLGANLWTASGGQADSHHLGAVIGMVSLGMLAFISFRTVTILLTAIAGSAMAMFGALGLMLQVDVWRDPLVQSMSDHTRAVPMLTAAVAGVSAVVQWGGGFNGLVARANKCAPAAAKPGAKPA